METILGKQGVAPRFPRKVASALVFDTFPSVSGFGSLVNQIESQYLYNNIKLLSIKDFIRMLILSLLIAAKD
jgi:hypothetical protein